MKKNVGVSVKQRDIDFKTLTRAELSEAAAVLARWNKNHDNAMGRAKEDEDDVGENIHLYHFPPENAMPSEYVSEERKRALFHADPKDQPRVRAYIDLCLNTVYSGPVRYAPNDVIATMYDRLLTRETRQDIRS